MTVTPAITERPAAKHRRRPPLLVGLVMIAVVATGYLGWQYFAQSPAAVKPKPLPPVPVIAATVQKRRAGRNARFIIFAMAVAPSCAGSNLSGESGVSPAETRKPI
jgi:hypothetical protein